MPLSVRDIQTEWNRLVPRARAEGIRVRMWNSPAWTVEYGMNRLNWLRARLGDTTVLTPVADQPVELDEDLASFTFGVEIECIMPDLMTRTTLATAIRTGAGVDAIAGTRTTRTDGTFSHWAVVLDGSLSGNACEVRSPILQGIEGFTKLREVCKVLTAKGCKVDTRCGLHVHVGARGRELGFFKRLACIYKNYEDVIDTFMAASRRGSANPYCGPQPYSYEAVDRVRTLNGLQRIVARTLSHRRFKLNFASYFYRHGTVEFRHHQGTVDWEKVENWTKFCLRMCSLAAAQSRYERDTSPDLDKLLGTLQASAQEQEYFRRRQQHFAARARIR